MHTHRGKVEKQMHRHGGKFGKGRQAKQMHTHHGKLGKAGVHAKGSFRHCTVLWYVRLGCWYEANFGSILMQQGTSERGENMEDASTCMEGALKAKGCRTRGCGRNQPSKSQKFDTQSVSVEDWGFDGMLRTQTATYVQKQFCRNTCPVRNIDVAFCELRPICREFACACW